MKAIAGLQCTADGTVTILPRRAHDRTISTRCFRKISKSFCACPIGRSRQWNVCAFFATGGKKNPWVLLRCVLPRKVWICSKIKHFLAISSTRFWRISAKIVARTHPIGRSHYYRTIFLFCGVHSTCCVYLFGFRHSLRKFGHFHENYDQKREKGIKKA